MPKLSVHFNYLDNRFLSSLASNNANFFSKSICFLFILGLSGLKFGKTKTPPPLPDLVYIGYLRDKCIMSFSIVRLHTPNSTAKFPIVSCRLLQSVNKIDCRLSCAVTNSSPCGFRQILHSKSNTCLHCKHHRRKDMHINCAAEVYNLKEILQ